MGFLPVILMGVYRCMVMNTVIITSDHSAQKTFIIITSSAASGSVHVAGTHFFFWNLGKMSLIIRVHFE